MPQAQSADGVLHDFPDGTSPDVIDRTMKQYATDATPSKVTPVASGDVPVAPSEHYQTWPERLVRGVGQTIMGGVETTKEAMTGQFGPPGSREFTEAAIPGATQAAALGITGAPGVGEAVGATADAAAKARATRTVLPSANEIKQSAQAAYQAVADARLVASPEAIEGFVNDAKASLDKELIVDINAPRSYRALEQLQAAGGDVGQIMAIRQKLGAITPADGTEYEAANHVRDAIDNFVENLKPGQVVSGDPKFTQAMLDHARSSWRAYRKLEQVEEAGKVGEHRAAVSGTGANSQNAMRQRIREILDSDKKSRGFSPETKAKMEEIVVGTLATNAARYAGKYAPSGPVSAGATVGADLLFGPKIATGVAVGALISKYLGQYLTKVQIRELENMIRMESPTGRAAASGIAAQPPGATANALQAATPALIPGAGSALAGQGP